MTNRSRIWFVLSSLLFTLLAACAPTEEEALPTLVPTATPAPPTATASATPPPTFTPSPTPKIPRTQSEDPNRQSYARVVHANAALPAVDVYLDDLLFAPYLEYGQFIEASGIEAGMYALRVYPVGQRDTAPPVFEMVAVIDALKTYHVVLYESNGKPQVTLFEEDMRPVTGSQSRISLINAMPKNVNLALQEGTQALLTTSASGQMSPPRLLEAGELVYNLRLDGAILRGSRQRIAARESYTFVVTAPADDLNNVRVMVLRSRLAGLAEVRVVSIAQDNTLDLLLNGKPLAEQLGTHYVTDFQQLATQDYELRVYASGSDRSSVEPLVLTRFSPQPNERITLVIIGKGNDLRVVTHRANGTPTNVAQARLFVLHGLYEVPRVQGQMVTETSINLAYGQVTQVGEIPAGDFGVTWNVQRGSQLGEQLQTIDGIRLNEGEEYLYIFSGRTDLPLLLLSERVGVRVATPSPAEVAAQPTPVLPPVMRAINAIAGLTVEFRVDDVPIASGIASRTGSSTPATLLAGERVLTVVNNETQTLLARLITQLESGKAYVFIAHGRFETGYEIMLLEDTRFGSAPTTRLINLSPVSTEMGLAYNVSTNTVEPFPDLRTLDEPPIVSTQEVLDENGNVIGYETVIEEKTYRLSILGGLVRQNNNIASNAASTVAPIEGSLGSKDFYVIDNFTASVSNILPAVLVRENTHYDVIAIQDRFTSLVDAFIVPYTRP